MKIEQFRIENIIPFEKNNRKHSDLQIDRIAKSITEFGFNQPIVIDDDNIVLVGHGRLQAAKKLGLETVPVLQVTGLKSDQKKAYRILDNKLQNDSEWDFANLESELATLEELDFNLEEWGLDDLRKLFPQDEEAIFIEDSGEVRSPKEIYVKSGDLIELGNHRLLCGDCTNIEDVQKFLSGKIIDLVITDPPYGVSYQGKTKDALEIQNDNLSESELLEMWNNCLNNLIAFLKEGGVIYATVPAVPLRHIFSNPLRERGILRQELIWLKNSLVLGHSDYHFKHEPILYGWKPGASHYFINDRSKTDVLEHDRPQRSSEHPTMKPISLFCELVKNSSKVTELVFDPFLGSGTTLIACDQLNRICYGIEIDPGYCQVVLERYKKYCQENSKEFICKINGDNFLPPKLSE